MFVLLLQGRILLLQGRILLLQSIVLLLQFVFLFFDGLFKIVEHCAQLILHIHRFPCLVVMESMFQPRNHRFYVTVVVVEVVIDINLLLFGQRFPALVQNTQQFVQMRHHPHIGQPWNLNDYHVVHQRIGERYFTDLHI